MYTSSAGGQVTPRGPPEPRAKDSVFCQDFCDIWEFQKMTQKSAILSLGAQERVQKLNLGLSHEFFFCMDLEDIHRYLHTKFHPNWSKYMVADKL